MKTLKIIFFTVCCFFLLIECTSENNFTIEKGKVGLLSSNTTVKDLKFVFSKDSIVSQLSAIKTDDEDSFFNDDEYEIFDKDGKKILELVPIHQKDSTSKIKSVQIFTPSYTTKKGINLQSTFKDIKDNYKINKVETTLNSATLYIDELNATISIDKKDIGVSKFSSQEIQLEQIPDISKIKYFNIWFN